MMTIRNLKIKIILFLFFSIINISIHSSIAHAENQFNVRLIADPQTWDWTLATTTMETPLLLNIMEGLVEFDPQMNVKPSLAESWSISSDFKTYTFKLKSGIRWSDGKPLTAQDFIYSWQRLLNPLTGAPYAYILFDIEGAQEFNAKKIKDFSSVGIKAIDPQTIQIKLKQPVSYFIQMLSFWVTFPLRQDLIEKHGTSWTKPGNIVVLGPFIPTLYQPQIQILLKRNSTYYRYKNNDSKINHADTVALKIINEDSTALNLFKNGQLDFLRPINFLELGALKDSPQLHKSPYFRTVFLNLNTNKYPFNLPKFRQALSMSIDRKLLPQVIHNQIQTTAAIVPAALFPEGKNQGNEFNPTEAKKILKEIGIDPTILPALDLVAYSSDENALITQFVQDQLKKNLGLNVEIRLPEFKMFRSQLELQTASFYLRYWGADYADPHTFFGVFLSESGNNRTGWKNATYDQLVKKAATTPNGPDRTKLYLEAQQILVTQEAPVITLYTDTFNYLLNPKVKNFNINPLNYSFFRDIIFTP